MKMTHYITLINKTYYFRARFPQHVVEILGRKELKRSLRTDSRSEAVKRFPPVMQEYQNMIEGAERQQEVQQSLEPRNLTDGELMGFAASWVKANQSFQPVLKLQQTNSEDIAKRKEVITNYEERIRPQRQQQLAINDFGSVVPQVRRQLKDAGVELDLDNRSHLRLCQTMLRAVICLEEKANNERKGEFNTSLQDNILQLLERHEEAIVVQPQSSSIDNDETLRELIEGYTADREVKWAKSTISGNKTAFELLIEALGADTPLSEINRIEARNVLEILERLPINRKQQKKLKGLPLNKQIETAEKLNMPTISVETINSAYLRAIKPMFEWAKEEQLIMSNPFVKLNSNKLEASRDTTTSIPIPILQDLFKLAPWSPRNETYEGMPSLFWGPLIALHHGCRVGEVASLFVSDIIEEAGIASILFKVIEDGDEVQRGYKTKNAVRVVPIHPHLIKMGFMRFVSEQKRANHTQLFPEHTKSANNKWGRKLTNWFNPTIKGLTGEPNKYKFHSFRHNFQDALRRAGLHGKAEAQVLSGRTANFSDINKNADTVADGYGTGFTAKYLEQFIATISYEGLDLSHLYVDDDE